MKRFLARHRAILGALGVGAAFAWQPGLTMSVLLGVGALVLTFLDIRSLVGAILVVRPALDLLSDLEIPLGPLKMNPPSVVGLALLGSGAIYLTTLGLRHRRIDWGGTPAVALGLLLALAALGILNGVRVLGSAALAPGLRETIRLSTYLVFYVTVVNAVRGGLGAATLVGALFAGAVIPLGRGLWQFAYYRAWGLYEFGPTAVPHGRLTGTFFHATAFGLYLALLVLLALTLLRRGGGLKGLPRAVPLLVLPIALFLLVFTFARGAWIFLLLAVLVRALLDPRKVLPPLLAVALLAGIAFGPRIIARFSDITTGVNIRQLVQKPSDINSFEWRLYNWVVLAGVAREQPILGHGTASTGLVNPHRTRRVGEEQTGFSAHSDLIGYAVEYGAIGVLVLCGFYTLLIRWLARLHGRARSLPLWYRDLTVLCLGMTAGLFALGALSQSPISSTVTFYFLLALLGLLRGGEASLTGLATDAPPDRPSAVDSPGGASYASCAFDGPDSLGSDHARHHSPEGYAAP